MLRLATLPLVAAVVVQIAVTCATTATPASSYAYHTEPYCARLETHEECVLDELCVYVDLDQVCAPKEEVGTVVFCPVDSVLHAVKY